jgi:hypothetical protein
VHQGQTLRRDCDRICAVNTLIPGTDEKYPNERRTLHCCAVVLEGLRFVCFLVFPVPRFFRADRPSLQGRGEKSLMSQAVRAIAPAAITSGMGNTSKNLSPFSLSQVRGPLPIFRLPLCLKFGLQFSLSIRF